MQRQSVKVTVLVAVYNAGQYLRQCLDSLCRQTLTDIQIVCIDDCSTDGSPAILDDYATRDSRITVLRTPVNSGQAAARHLGLLQARGEYTAFLDSDDWLAPDSLATLTAALTTGDDIDCALFRLVNYNDDDGTYDDYLRPGLTAQPFKAGETLTGEEAFRLSLDWTIHGVLAVRTHIYKECPPAERRSLYDDENITRRQLLAARRVVITAAPYFYRRHSRSSTQGFSPRRLDMMEAMLDLRQLVERQGFTDLLRPVERQLWLAVVDCYMLYRDNRRQLTADERRDARQRFATMLRAVKARRLPWRLRMKPGYIPVRHLPLFCLMEEAYFGLRGVFYVIKRAN